MRIVKDFDMKIVTVFLSITGEPDKHLHKPHNLMICKYKKEVTNLKHRIQLRRILNGILLRESLKFDSEIKF